MIDITNNIDIARNVDKYSDKPKNSRLKNGVIGAAVGSGFCGVTLLGDKFIPNATVKIVHLLNFTTPPKEKITKSVFGDISTKNKLIGVAAITLINGIIGAVFLPHKKNEKV